MLCGNTMPRSNNAPLEQAKSRFDCIRVNIAIDIDSASVTNSFVLGTMNACPDHRFRISRKLISDHYIDIGTDVTPNVLCQRPALGVLGMEESQVAATLPNADHNFLVVMWPVPASASVLMSADIGLVHFHGATQLWLVSLLYRVANAMEKIPSRAIVNLEHPVKLMSRHSLFRLAKQVRCKEPFSQRQVRVMEDRACGHRELVAA